jgi:hypothetical protein
MKQHTSCCLYSHISAIVIRPIFISLSADDEKLSELNSAMNDMALLTSSSSHVNRRKADIGQHSTSIPLICAPMNQLTMSFRNSVTSQYLQLNK